MRFLCIVLSAGVLAGLAAFGILIAFDAVGIAPNGAVHLSIPVAVSTIAGIGFGASAIALSFNAAMLHGEAKRFELHDRRHAPRS